MWLQPHKHAILTKNIYYPLSQKGRTMAIELTDTNFKDTVKESDKPVVKVVVP